MAGEFFVLIGERFPEVAHSTGELSGIYATISEALAKAGDRESDSVTEKEWIAQAQGLESEAIARIAEVRNSIQAEMEPAGRRE